MNEKIQKIIDILEQNEELKKYYYDNPPKTNEEFIAAAKELGVELTEDDFKFAATELSEEELEQIAAGEKRSKDGIKDACGVGMLIVCGAGAGAMYWA